MKKEILRISQLGIVYSDTGFEVILEDFLNCLEENIKNNNYSVIFNEKDFNFDVIYGGSNYTLLLDSNIKEKLAQGEYNNTTFRLKKLADMKLQINKSEAEKEAEKKKEEEARQKIIDDADKNILPNDEAKLIYLNELKKRRNKVFPTSLKAAFEDDLMNLDDYSKICFIDVFLHSLVHLSLMALGATIGYGGGYFIGSFFNASHLLALGGIIIGALSLPIRKLLKFYLPPLKKAFDERKILTHKIKALEESLKYKNSKSMAVNFFERSLPNPVKAFPYQFKDDIYRELSALLDRIEYINNLSDKERLKNEVKTILKEYKNGRAEIDTADSIEIFTGKNIYDLRGKIRQKIDKIDLELASIRAKEISSAELDKERKILENRLGPVELDAIELQSIITEKEQNKVRVRAR